MEDTEDTKFAEVIATSSANGPPRVRELARVPIICKDTTITLGFRAGILADSAVIFEIKAVATLIPAHEARMLPDLPVSLFRVAH